MNESALILSAFEHRRRVVTVHT